MASAFIYSFTKMAKWLQEFKLKVIEYYLSGHATSVRSQIFNVHRLDSKSGKRHINLMLARLYVH